MRQIWLRVGPVIGMALVLAAPAPVTWAQEKAEVPRVGHAVDVD